MKILSAQLHTIIGLVVGLALIVAPWLFGFADDGGPAMIVPIALGVFILLSELTTTSPISLVKLVPMKVHVFIDMVAGLLLLASPWLFGFSDKEANAWVPHVIVGILIIGYALLTDTTDDEESIVAE